MIERKSYTRLLESLCYFCFFLQCFKGQTCSGPAEIKHFSLWFAWLTFRSWHFGCAPVSVLIFWECGCGVQLGHLWPVLVNGRVAGAPSRKSPANKQRAPSAEQRGPQLCRSLLSQAKPPSWPCHTAIVKWLELCVLTYCPWQDSVYAMLPMAQWWCVASVQGRTNVDRALWWYDMMSYQTTWTIMDKSDSNEQSFNFKCIQNDIIWVIVASVSVLPTNGSHYFLQILTSH